MESKAKLFGHAIHPMLIVFPLGLLPVAVIFDIIGLVTKRGQWHDVAFYLIAAGVLGGLLAAIFGTIDWVAIPAGTRAKQIGLTHGAGNVVVVVFFGTSWLLRYAAPAAPSTLAVALGCVGLALALFTAWLGGELVERLGVGVDKGAHLNAPSSLSDSPAGENAIPAQPGAGQS